MTFNSKALVLAFLTHAPVHAITLQSGFELPDVGNAPKKVVASEVYYHGGTSAAAHGDNIVVSTTAGVAFAHKQKAGLIGAGGAFFVETGPGLMPIKSYYSSKLDDTLTTASKQGLAWAEDAAHGYKFLQIEGYCRTESGAGTKQLVQYWSEGRNDSFVVVEGSSHERSALSANYTKVWSECWTAPPPPTPDCRVGTDCGGTGEWTEWADKPPTPTYTNPGAIPFPKCACLSLLARPPARLPAAPSSPSPVLAPPLLNRSPRRRSKDLLGWEYKSGANPGYGGGNHVARSADTWYPSWGADGNLYTPWTDGSVVDDVSPPWS
eukprot:SAG11_NODE_787_length_7169_cov_4.571146_11_plen_322_part_00